MNTLNISERDIEAQFLEFLRVNDCEPEGNFTLQMDGQLHRFRLQGDKAGEKTGAYCVYTDGWPAGWCQNWRNGGESITWSYPKGEDGKYKDYFESPEFKKARELSQQRQAKFKAEQEAQSLRAQERVRILWEQLRFIAKTEENHEYLNKKQIYPYGLKLGSDKVSITVPMQNIDGKIVNLQSISPDGEKRFYPNAPVSGNFFAIDFQKAIDNEKEVILIGEGMATMSTVYEMTNLPCIAAMNCGNIMKVAQAVRSKYKNPIVIMADNDHKKERNAGKQAAEEANEKLKLNGVVMPDFADNEDGTDWNDFFNLHDCDVAFCRKVITRKLNQCLKKPEQQEQPEQSEQEQQEQQAIEMSDAEYLDKFFERDIRNYQRYSERKTGFSNLDERLTLYPGLYVIGAVSSLGKTTFSLQLADNFASMGEHVLFFSLEQTRFELMSKSLARLCQPVGKLYESSPSAFDIRNGRITPELRNAMQKYKEIARHYSTVECNFETTVNTIIDTILAYIQKYEVKPIVFIDYLQLVRSSKPKLTNTKDIVDDVVRALKKFQMQNELVMFVVSSLNRQNYLTPIDFEAFKESGSIEYTSDVVIGLQLAVMNATIFETDTKTGEKRKVVKAAKKETPRHIELCVLKNRYGISNESFYFQYYPRYDLFIPSTFEIAKEAVKSLVKAKSSE